MHKCWHISFLKTRVDCCCHQPCFPEKMVESCSQSLSHLVVPFCTCPCQQKETRDGDPLSKMRDNVTKKSAGPLANTLPGCHLTLSEFLKVSPCRVCSVMLWMLTASLDLHMISKCISNLKADFKYSIIFALYCLKCGFIPLQEPVFFKHVLCNW